MFAKVAVADVCAAGFALGFLAQGGAFAGFAGGDLDPGGGVFEQVKGDVEAHGVVEETLASAAVERPRHAGQRGEERAVARHPALGAQAGREGAQIGQLAGEAGEEIFQQGGVEQMLRLREAAEAHFGHAHFLLHAGQPAGRDDAAHGACDGVGEAEQEKAQVIAEGQAPLGVGEGAVEGRLALRDGLVEHFTETRQHLQGAKALFGEDGRGVGARCGQARTLCQYGYDRTSDNQVTDW